MVFSHDLVRVAQSSPKLAGRARRFLHPRRVYPKALTSVTRSLFGRAAMTRQVPRRVDQPHVRECLGKIAD
jgi:hypothetical protein